jgi:hypothetical protein
MLDLQCCIAELNAEQNLIINISEGLFTTLCEQTWSPLLMHSERTVEFDKALVGTQHDQESTTGLQMLEQMAEGSKEEVGSAFK